MHPAYETYRATFEALRDTILAALPPERLSDVAQALGAALEAHPALIADVAIFSHPGPGLPSPVEQHKRALTQAPSWQQALVLQAALAARFRLMQVLSTAPGQLTVRDALYAEQFTLTDARLSQSAPTGGTFVGRVLVLPELTMSTGALMPVSARQLERIKKAARAGRLPATPRDMQDSPPIDVDRATLRILQILLTPPNRKRRRRR